ncbi:MAG: histone deacetylase [Pseudomonadota bacterium]
MPVSSPLPTTAYAAPRPGLAVVTHPAFHAPLPAGHRFPMHKYRRLAEVLVEDGIVPRGGFIEPAEAPADWLALAHERAYVDQVLSASAPPEVERRIGLPITPAMALRTRTSCAATLLAGRLALERGIACTTAGGSHHARRDGGRGFCVFNDVAVAVLNLKAAGEIGTCAVIDCDVHQGDGTADILADSALFTCSIHAEKNYPSDKVPSDLDVGLPDGVDDAGYRDVLAAHVPGLLDHVRPDIVFYNAGVDPHVEDKLGRLALTDRGLRARDAYVIDQVRRRGIPFVGVIGGGYADDVEVLARRHAGLHAEAAKAA